MPTWKENPGPADLRGPRTRLWTSRRTACEEGFDRGLPAAQVTRGRKDKTRSLSTSGPGISARSVGSSGPVRRPAQIGGATTWFETWGQAVRGTVVRPPPHLDHRGRAGISSHRRKRSGRPLPWHPTTAGCSGFDTPGTRLPVSLPLAFCLPSYIPYGLRSDRFSWENVESQFCHPKLHIFVWAGWTKSLPRARVRVGPRFHLDRGGRLCRRRRGSRGHPARSAVVAGSGHAAATRSWLPGPGAYRRRRHRVRGGRRVSPSSSQGAADPGDEDQPSRDA